MASPPKTRRVETEGALCIRADVDARTGSARPQPLKVCLQLLTLPACVWASRPLAPPRALPEDVVPPYGLRACLLPCLTPEATLQVSLQALLIRQSVQLEIQGSQQVESLYSQYLLHRSLGKGRYSCLYGRAVPEASTLQNRRQPSLLAPRPPPRPRGRPHVRGSHCFSPRPLNTEWTLSFLTCGDFSEYLMEKRDESNLFDSTCTHQGGAVQGHSKQVTICKPRRKASPEPGHPDTVILDFQPQTCEQINWFRHPVYGILSWQPKPTISKSYWLYLQHTLRIQPISPDSTVTP
ncbi:uncharacterized protein [Desmodus rotundus]|uniref:uncharacterized protein n=1 Tax=Desmodus rotundus TaxID=9430 RepID=UPI002380C811|nr:uncharacterized protein LOC123479832 [Desmodus rotundus]